MNGRSARQRSKFRTTSVYLDKEFIVPCDLSTAAPSALERSAHEAPHIAALKEQEVLKRATYQTPRQDIPATETQCRHWN
jgi:hypothetical protein